MQAIQTELAYRPPSRPALVQAPSPYVGHQEEPSPQQGTVSNKHVAECEELLNRIQDMLRVPIPDAPPDAAAFNIFENLLGITQSIKLLLARYHSYPARTVIVDVITSLADHSSNLCFAVRSLNEHGPSNPEPVTNKGASVWMLSSAIKELATLVYQQLEKLTPELEALRGWIEQGALNVAQLKGPSVEPQDSRKPVVLRGAQHQEGHPMVHPALKLLRDLEDDRTERVAARVINNFGTDHTSYLLVGRRSVAAGAGEFYAIEKELPLPRLDPTASPSLLVECPVTHGEIKVPTRAKHTVSRIIVDDHVITPGKVGPEISITIGLTRSTSGSFTVRGLPSHVTSATVAMSLLPDTDKDSAEIRALISNVPTAEIVLPEWATSALQYINRSQSHSLEEAPHSVMAIFSRLEWVYDDDRKLWAFFNQIPAPLRLPFLAGLRVSDCSWQARVLHVMLQHAGVMSLVEDGACALAGTDTFRVPGHTIVTCLSEQGSFYEIVLDPTCHNFRARFNLPSHSAYLEEMLEKLSEADVVEAFRLGERMRGECIRTAQFNFNMHGRGHNIKEGYNESRAAPYPPSHGEAERLIHWVKGLIDDQEVMNSDRGLRLAFRNNEKFSNYLNNYQKGADWSRDDALILFLVRVVKYFALQKDPLGRSQAIANTIHDYLGREALDGERGPIGQYFKLFVRDAGDSEVIQPLAATTNRILSVWRAQRQAEILAPLYHGAIASLSDSYDPHVAELLCRTYYFALKEEKKRIPTSLLRMATHFDPYSLLFRPSTADSELSFAVTTDVRVVNDVLALVGEDGKSVIAGKVHEQATHFLRECCAKKERATFGKELLGLLHVSRTHTFLLPVVKSLGPAWYAEIMGYIYHADDSLERAAIEVVASYDERVDSNRERRDYAKCSKILQRCIDEGIVSERSSRKWEGYLLEKVDLLQLIIERVKSQRDNQFYDFIGCSHSMGELHKVLLGVVVALGPPADGLRGYLWAKQLIESEAFKTDYQEHLCVCVERDRSAAVSLINTIAATTYALRPEKKRAESAIEQIVLTIMYEAEKKVLPEDTPQAVRIAILQRVVAHAAGGLMPSSQEMMESFASDPVLFEGQRKDIQPIIEGIVEREVLDLWNTWGDELPKIASAVAAQDAETPGRKLIRGVISYAELAIKERELNPHMVARWKGLFESGSTGAHPDSLIRQNAGTRVARRNGMRDSSPSDDVPELRPWQSMDPAAVIDSKVSARLGRLITREYVTMPVGSTVRQELILDLGYVVLDGGLSDAVPEVVFGFISKQLRKKKKPTLALYYHGALLQLIDHLQLTDWMHRGFKIPLTEVPLILKACQHESLKHPILKPRSNWVNGPLDEDEVHILIGHARQTRSEVVLFEDLSFRPYSGGGSKEALRRVLGRSGLFSIVSLNGK